jgi:hypothetical protein
LFVAASTANSAWASTPNVDDVSGKKPATTPQSDPSLQNCLANGVHSALYQRCVAAGLIKSSSIEGTDNLQNGDYIKLQGFFVNPQNQVVSNSFEFVVASIETWTPPQ